jgi:two-component system, sensor histidine kinase and response regulator
MDTSSFEPEKMQVLLIDDTPANIDVLARTLEPEGYKILIANNGEKGIKIASHLKPDLILLDIMMPTMDGFAVCKSLKLNPETYDIPVIFCTAKTEVSDMVNGFAVGAVDYITKPYRQAEVLARVKTHLQLRHNINLLAQRNAELDQLNKTKNKFLGIAAHDLRNPIGIINMLSLLFRDEFDDCPRQEVLEGLDMMFKASEIMLNLVNDLLDVSAIENGNLNLNCQPGSLLELVQSRLNLSRFHAEHKNIRIESKLMEIPEYSFDANRLGQVFDNLIGNAIKFSPPETTIWVRLEVIDGTPCFSVRDQGPGFDKDDWNNLFKEFQQLSAKPTDGEKSTGLGLVIVKKIVDAHHGSIEVQNHPDGGALFKVFLPN